MKNHYIYLITNKINNKKYIGKRSCNCKIENDEYMGSGKILRKAFVKYGIENFSKQILLVCETEEQALKEEKKAIELVKAYEDNNYYNIAEGGRGGNLTAGYNEYEMQEYKNKLSKSNKVSQNRYEVKIKKSKSLKIAMNKPEVIKKLSQAKNRKGIQHTEETKMKMSKAKKGRTLSEEHKAKLSESKKGKLTHNAKEAIVVYKNKVYEFKSKNQAYTFFKDNFQMSINMWFSNGIPKSKRNDFQFVGCKEDYYKTI